MERESSEILLPFSKYLQNMELLDTFDPEDIRVLNNGNLYFTTQKDSYNKLLVEIADTINLASKTRKALEDLKYEVSQTLNHLEHLFFGNTLTVLGLTRNLMQCIEDKKEAKYKCPSCESPYCSVACFKVHKSKCSHINDAHKKPLFSHPKTDVFIPRNEAKCPQFNRILRDKKVSTLLSSKGVRTHIKLLYEIMKDPKLSGEMNSEGRRHVALKKLRELRKGGREANEAIEELVCTVTSVLSAEAAQNSIYQ